MCLVAVLYQNGHGACQAARHRIPKHPPLWFGRTCIFNADSPTTPPTLFRCGGCALTSARGVPCMERPLIRTPK